MALDSGVGMRHWSDSVMGLGPWESTYILIAWFRHAIDNVRDLIELLSV
jgi:hypothetical protein